MSVGVASPTQPSVPLRQRLGVEQLSGAQVAELRRAFAAVQGISDDRGYLHFAGIHGLPLPMYCTHGTPLFLPWHRAYLYFFEFALRDQATDPTFALPWWEWTSAASHASGIPPAYAQPDDGGQPNPLYSAQVDPVALEQSRAQGDAVSAQTARASGDPGQLPSTADLELALSQPDFLGFSQQIEDIHNSVHGWVGGHMGQIPVAAYDPVFWAHHGMIDRAWRLWQLRHGNASVPPQLLGQALAPFSMTVQQTLDPTSLGYDYAATAAQVGN